MKKKHNTDLLDGEGQWESGPFVVPTPKKPKITIVACDTSSLLDDLGLSSLNDMRLDEVVERFTSTTH